MKNCRFQWCFPCLFCAPPSRDAWISSLKDALQDRRELQISEKLRQALLRHDDHDDWYVFDDNDSADESRFLDQCSGNPQFLLKGLPKHPLYVELGTRLRALSTIKSENIPLFLPAEYFGLTENPFDNALLAKEVVPKHPSKQSMIDWINHAGTGGIFHLLGMRNTVGTDSRDLLPPSWCTLLEAAALPHKEKSQLSVAARARSKHAHRGKDHFFGVVSGPPTKQNVETQEILVRLLENAAWINIHAFGGNDGDPFLEVRVASGYGARWEMNWSNTDNQVHHVSFRGFLEPQMPFGHKNKWRH